MYDFTPAERTDLGTDESYNVLDPDGVVLATVYSLSEAQALISHLNR